MSSGETFGSFRLLRPLGQGGFAEVWLAETPEGEQVALKRLHPRHLEARELVARFAREAKILSRLRHPAIAGAKTYGRVGKVPYIAMDFVPGPNLQKKLASQDEPYPLEWVTSFALQITRGLAHAHEAGVVHRDVKPNNIILRHGEPTSACLVDFGIARLLELPKDQQTTQGRMLGTLQYIAPEQIFKKSLDPAVDIFGFGCVAFMALTGRSTWLRDREGQPAKIGEHSQRILLNFNTGPDLMRRICKGPRPRPSRWRPNVPPAMDELIMSALAVDPRNRPSAIEFGDAMQMAMKHPSPRMPSVTSFYEMEEDHTELSDSDSPATRVAPSDLDRPSGSNLPSTVADRPSALSPEPQTRLLAESIHITERALGWRWLLLLLTAGFLAWAAAAGVIQREPIAAPPPIEDTIPTVTKPRPVVLPSIVVTPRAETLAPTPDRPVRKTRRRRPSNSQPQPASAPPPRPSALSARARALVKSPDSTLRRGLIEEGLRRARALGGPAGRRAEHCILGAEVSGDGVGLATCLRTLEDASTVPSKP